MAAIAIQSKLVTTEQLESIVSIPSYTLRRHAREGTLPAYKPTPDSRGYLWDPDEIISIIKNHKNS